MTATTQETPTPPPPVQVPIEHRKKSRALPITVGAALATFGSVLAIAGGGVLAVAGNDGTVGSGNHDVSTPTAAIVSDTADVDGVSDLSSAFGDPKFGISASAKDGGPAKFVGIGPAADVDRYLADVEVDRVPDIEVAPFKLEKHRREGHRTPAAPTAQTFWVAQDSGTHADLDWKVRDGDYKVVVMNADGSRGVESVGHFEAGAPYLSSVALSALLAGLMALGAGGVVLARTLS
jgi:hypothetical protein